MRGLRRFRRHCWKLLVWFVIASAVVVSIGRLVAPYADAFRPVVEQFLAQALDQPVRIERIEASWPRLSPRITMHGLEVGTVDDRLMDVDRARLEFKLYNLVRPGRNSFELIVLGLNLVLIQDEQGQWSWRLDRGGNFADGWEAMVSAGDVFMRDSGVRIAPHGLPDLNWSVPNARLSRHSDRLRLHLDALPAGGTGELLEARLVLHMQDSRLHSLSGYARSPNIALSQTAFDSTRGGVGDLRAQMQWWLDWNRSEGARFHGQVVLHSLVEGGIAGRLSSRFALDGRWQGDELLVELNAREFGDHGEVLIDGLAYGNREGRHAIVADRIDLQYLHALMQPWLGFFEFWPRRLSGTVTDLNLGLGAAGSLYTAGGRFDGLKIGLVRPGLSLSVQHLDLSLAGDRLQVRPSGSAVVEMPELYPDPLNFDRVGGTVGLRRDRVDLSGLTVEHPEFSMTVDGTVELVARKPILDLVVDVPRLSPASPPRWLPARGIRPKTRKWLEESLLELASLNAVTTLFGNPGEWKHRVRDGSINSLVVFSGLHLAYARGWPIAGQLAGSVEFSGQSMQAVVESGQAAGVHLRAPEIRIADVRDAEIELRLATIETEADELARLAAALPLGDQARALDQLDWEGPATAEANVWLPVKHRSDWRLLGSVDFQRVDMSVREHGVSLVGITGSLPFTRERIGPASLAANMQDRAVEVALDARFTPDFTLALRGRFPVHGLIPAGWKSGMTELLDRVEGSADFAIDFAQDDPAIGESGLVMRVASDLEGVSLHLPMPLEKPAAAIWPFELVLPLGDGRRPVRFEIGGKFAGRWMMTSDYWQLGLGLGGTEVDLPAAENFIVEGRLPSLEIDRWLGLLADVSTTGLHPDSDSDAPGLSGWMDVVVDDLRIQETLMGEVELSLNREDHYWRLKGLGERIEGSMRFPASGEADRSIVADMTRLSWPVAGGTEPEPPAPPSGLDPRRLPAIDIVIRQFDWGELDLGEIRLSSHRDDRGLQLEQVSSSRDGFDLTGSGEWLWSGGAPRTRMRIRLAVEDLGQTLDGAGFDIVLQRGKSVIELDGSWPGSPIDLSLQRVDGSLDLVVTDGAIPEASPGAGRLLGLVSLNSIPRRLRLDFSDVFGDGLSFDRVAGHFELADGAAVTDDMRIDAPAAEVRMHGRTDLKNRTYDQTLIVRPGLGSALPVIGALAGGPVGAAAGAALQQIFSRPLGGVTEVRYSVTGSWQQPVIAPVAVQRAEPEND